MKKILILIMILIPISGYNQINLAKPEDFNRFLETKTLVVSHEDIFSDFNNVIKRNLEMFWDITEYDFIPFKEFGIKKNNNNFSFIILTDARREANGKEYIYNILNLILGGRTETLDDMPDLGSVPLSYLNVPEESYLYKIGGMLQFMQYYVKANISNPKSDIKKLIKSNSNAIPQKELWIVKEELDKDVNTIEKIRSVYPYACRIVEKKDIEQAIYNKNDKVIYLHKVGPEGTINGGECWKFIISAGDGRPMYFDRHQIDKDNPDAILKEDFIRLGKK